MADYYPLIARAVAGLDKNTGENRRALYERARAALVNQLRGVDPPLDESDITRERLALEEAIRRLEVEAAKRVRPDSPEPDDKSHSLRDQGLRDFRDTVAEAQDLGEASAEASLADMAAMRLSLQSELVQNYLQLRVIDEQKRLLEATLATLLQGVRRADHREGAPHDPCDVGVGPTPVV